MYFEFNFTLDSYIPFLNMYFVFNYKSILVPYVCVCVCVYQNECIKLCFHFFKIFWCYKFFAPSMFIYVTR